MKNAFNFLPASLGLLMASSLLFFPPPSEAGLGQTVREKLAETDLKLETEVIGLDLADFAKLGVDVGVELTPNRDKKTYSRTERIALNERLGHSFSGPLPITLSSALRKGTQLEFIRQFDSQMDGLNLVKNPPYNLKDLPITAEAAKELQVTDYVRYQAELALSVSAGFGHSQGIIRVSGATSYVIHGDYQIEVYKKSDDKVLVRASALKQRSRQFGLSIGPTYKLDVFAVVPGDKLTDTIADTVNDKVNDVLIPTNFASISGSVTHGDLFTIEYLYNLDSPEAADAYEQLVNPWDWRFSSFKVANPLRGDKSTIEALIVHFEPSEEVALADADRSESERRVQRVMQAHSDFERRSLGLHMDLRLAKSSFGRSFVEQDFTFQKDHADWKRFRLVTYSLSSDAEFLFGWLEQKIRREADVLFEMDQANNIQRFIELSFSYSRDEKTQLRTEKRRVQGVLHRMMPESYHEGLSLDQLGGSFLRKDTRIDASIIFHRSAFEKLSQLSKAEIVKTVDEFAKMIEPTQYGSSRDKAYYGWVEVKDPITLNDDANRPITWLEKAQPELDEIKEQLTLILSPGSGLDNNQRWKRLAELRHNGLFHQIGPGLFARLLERAAAKDSTEFEQHVSFELTATARGGERIEVTIGDRERSQAFRNLVRAKNRILNRQFDPSFFQ